MDVAVYLSPLAETPVRTFDGPGLEETAEKVLGCIRARGPW